MASNLRQGLDGVIAVTCDFAWHLRQDLGSSPGISAGKNWDLRLASQTGFGIFASHLFLVYGSGMMLFSGRLGPCQRDI